MRAMMASQSQILFGMLCGRMTTPAEDE